MSAIPNRYIKAATVPSGPCQTKRPNGEPCGMPTVRVVGARPELKGRPSDHGPAMLTICAVCDCLGPAPG